MDEEQPGIDGRRATMVRDVMQVLVVGVLPEMTVRELIRVLVENTISGAPVLDSRGRPIGVVSMSDVMRLAAHEAEVPAGQLAWQPVLTADESSETEAAREVAELVPFTVPGSGDLPEAAFDGFQVRDIMTPFALSVRPTDSLATAARFLLQGRIHRVLVMEEGVLRGIVTPYDLLQAVDWDGCSGEARRAGIA